MTVLTKGLKQNGYVTARFLGSGEIQLNTSTVANAANTAGETVLSMTISKVHYNTSNGAYFTVSRGANVVAYYAGSGIIDYQEEQMPVDAIGGEATSNVVITKTGAGPSSLLMKLHKASS